MAKKKQRGRPVLSMEYYIVQITDWDWSYSFSVNFSKWDDRRYSIHRHLLARGNVLLPSSLKAKAETAELTFMSDVGEADFEPGDRAPPRGVTERWVLHGGRRARAGDADAARRSCQMRRHAR
jgi:hypothetical protein